MKIHTEYGVIYILYMQYMAEKSIQARRTASTNTSTTYWTLLFVAYVHR